MSACLRRQPAFYLPKELQWYGEKNLDFSSRFQSFNGATASQSFLKFNEKSTPKALVVFGSDPSLHFIAHANWLHRLCDHYDVMVISVETFSEMNVWFQNITARLMKLSLLVFNVHGATDSFSFDPANPDSSVSLSTKGFYPALLSVLQERSRVALCGCTTGLEPIRFSLQNGMYRKPSVARILANLLRDLNVEVVAPSRTITATSIRGTLHGVEFHDGSDDITARFGGGVSNFKSLLPFPDLLKKQLEVKKLKGVQKRRALIFEALNHLQLHSAVHLLRGYSGRRARLIQQAIGTAVEASLFHKGVIKQRKLVALVEGTLKAIENGEPVSEDYLSILGSGDTVTKLAHSLLKRGFDQEVLALLAYLDPKASADIFDGFFNAFMDCSSCVSVKALLVLCVGHREMNRITQQILQGIMEVKEITFQPREYSDLMRPFENRKDFALAEEFLQLAEKKEVFLAPKRKQLWSSQVSC